MTGRAKVFIGYHPAGYVLLRRPALWMSATTLELVRVVMPMNAHSSRLVFGHFAVLIVMSPWIAGCDAHRAAEPAPISAAVPVQASSAPPSASVIPPVDAKTLDPNHFADHWASGCRAAVRHRRTA